MPAATDPTNIKVIATERIHRAPDLNGDLLKEIPAVCVLERIRVDHFDRIPLWPASQSPKMRSRSLSCTVLPSTNAGLAGAPARNPERCKSSPASLQPLVAQRESFLTRLSLQEEHAAGPPGRMRDACEVHGGVLGYGIHA
jgi:hypothetical protein